MGNCCVTAGGAAGEGGGKTKKPKEPKQKKGKKPNPFSIEYNRSAPPGAAPRLVVLREPTGRDIAARYELGGELGRGEFGVTYLCTDRDSGEALACKSISKKKLRTPVDVEDVRREVEIMRHLPKHPNIVTLRDTYEDGNAVHPSWSSARAGSSSTGSWRGGTTQSAPPPWSRVPSSRSCR